VAYAMTYATLTNGLTGWRLLTLRARPTTGWNCSMKVERLKIPSVKAYISKGKLYAYHRKTGHRFKSLYGTAAFFEELREVEAKVKTQIPQPKEEKPGTWGGSVALYLSA
jgi:hypothetical protein